MEPATGYLRIYDYDKLVVSVVEVPIAFWAKAQFFLFAKYNKARQC